MYSYDLTWNGRGRRWSGAHAQCGMNSASIDAILCNNTCVTWCNSDEWQNSNSQKEGACVSNRTPALHFYMQQMRRPDARMHLLMAGEGGGGSGNNSWWAEDGDELVDAPRRVERLDITYARASKQARLHSALAALPIE